LIHIKGHPERLQPDSSTWTRYQWGNHLADRFCTSPNFEQEAILQQFPQARTYTLQTTIIDRHVESNLPFIIKCNGRPIMQPLMAYAHRNAINRYLTQRTLYHPEDTRWLHYQLRFSARIWSIPTRHASQNIQSVRIIYDNYLHEANALKHNVSPTIVPARCIFCNELPSEGHLAFHCRHQEIRQIRNYLCDQVLSYLRSLPEDSAIFYPIQPPHPHSAVNRL
jgi:hypothetical protein